MARPSDYTSEIYELIDPRDGAVRYIGKANDSKKRLKSHLRETRRKTPVYCWIAKLRLLGLSPQMSVVYVCPRFEWQSKEREAIATARAAGARLLNVADGGDEPFCPTEVRAANGRRNAIARSDSPKKARVASLKQRIGILLREGCVSDATKEKLRTAAANRPDLFGLWVAL